MQNSSAYIKRKHVLKCVQILLMFQSIMPLFSFEGLFGGNLVF